MAASEARIRANQANALHSTGPRTAEGKGRACRNSLKHGLTGNGIAIPDQDAAEVERRSAAYRAERPPSGALGEVLVRRLAVLSVRMERAVEQERAAIAGNVARALDEFEAPEGADEATAALLRSRAADVALFDPSQEACLARKYEAAAERSFFRALQELRQVERAARADSGVATPAPSREALGSFSTAEGLGSTPPSRPGEPARITPPSPGRAPERVASARNLEDLGSSYVPITVGRSR